LVILTPRMKVYLIAGPIIALVIQAILRVLIPNSQILSLMDFLITFYIFFSIFFYVFF